MSVDFNTFTTLNTYVLLATGNINLTGTNSITTNTFPANYAAGGTIGGSGSLTGGILNEGDKTTALSQLDTLSTNLDNLYLAGSVTILSTPISSQTLTPGIYTCEPSFTLSGGVTLTLNGAGTYIFASGLEGTEITLSGTINLINGAVLTDVYWCIRPASSSTMALAGTGLKGIFIQNSDNPSYTLNISSGVEVDGVVYSSNGANLNATSTTFNSETLCFLRNTLLLTNTGYKPIQDISVGDLVLSYGPISESQIISHSKPLFTPVTWIQSFKPSFRNSSTMPIHFQKDSLGPNIPQKDLWLSPFHGIFVDGKMTQAQQFINGTTITQDFDLEEVEYFHFETEEHCAVDAQGVKSETFINVNYAIRNLPSLNDASTSQKESIMT
uniref:Hedgehog/Intein (Hint) domain-containing protein n=1 Tax=viral metagenome TaxID=1070528 RepID=A0A6C0CZ59_9ZZZZ